MIYLGEFKAGDSVFYAANFHNDTGTVEDPSAIAAQLRAPDGTWTDLTAPAKQNAKVGHYGGTIDTTGFSAGQHVIRMAGTVTTAKAVATEFSFLLVANTAADIYTRVGAPAGASISADVAAIKDDTAAILTDTAEIGAAGAGLTALASAANLAAAIAYIDTEVQAILDIVGHAAHGNAALNTDLDALLGRLTALRAGYLDNLSAGAAALESTLTAMKGGAFNGATDSLEAIRDRGDVAWLTGGGDAAPTVEEIRIEMDANSTKLANLDDTISSRQASGDVTVGGYAAGQDPASLLLVTPANKLSTSAAGLVDITQAAADKVWDSAARTLTSFGTLISGIWTHATRKLTSAFTDEGAPRDMAATGAGGGEGSTIVVLPFSGSVQASYAQEGLSVEIIQGDSISIPYDLATDLTGWNVLFAAKASLDVAEYSIEVKDITASLTDVLNGRGVIPLTAVETGLTPGSYIAEIEIRKGAEVITAMRFVLNVKRQVIS